MWNPMTDVHSSICKRKKKAQQITFNLFYTFKFQLFKTMDNNIY